MEIHPLPPESIRRWKTSLPIQPGYYWTRRPESKIVTIVMITRARRRTDPAYQEEAPLELVAATVGGGGMCPLARLDGYSWYGPLVPPDTQAMLMPDGIYELPVGEEPGSTPDDQPEA